jgi:hypothetical protein
LSVRWRWRSRRSSRPRGLHEAVLHEAAQDAVQRLLGHAQDVEEVAHGGAGAALDEVERAVMGAAVVALLQDAVGVGGEAAIGEEHRLDAAAELLVREVEEPLSPLRSRSLGHASSLLAPRKIRQPC